MIRLEDLTHDHTRAPAARKVSLPNASSLDTHGIKDACAHQVESDCELFVGEVFVSIAIAEAVLDTIPLGSRKTGSTGAAVSRHAELCV
jgi:hypothetical protein